MAESGGETSITVNAPISMHMLAFLLQRTIVPEKWCDTIPCVYAPMRRSSGPGRSCGRRDGAQVLAADEAEAEQGRELAALGQLSGRGDATGEQVVGVTANVKPGISRQTSSNELSHFCDPGSYPI